MFTTVRYGRKKEYSGVAMPAANYDDTMAFYHSTQRCMGACPDWFANARNKRPIVFGAATGANYVQDRSVWTEEYSREQDADEPRFLGTLKKK